MIDDGKERYKLKEASKIIARGNITYANKILNKLESSVRDGSLQVFQTDSNIRYEFESDKKSRIANELNLIRSDANFLHGGLTWVDKKYDEQLSEALCQLPENLEAYWDDLNKWLEDNEPRLDYIFHDPDTPFIENEGAANKGLTKQQIIRAFEGLHFKTDEKWGRALATPPKWLKTCRVMKGRRGNNKISALWNPVLIAAALYDQHIPLKKLDAVFVGLRDWNNDWQEASESFR